MARPVLFAIMNTMKDKDCVFCKIVAGEIPSDKVYEDQTVLAFLDINPVNIGHSLVVTKNHYKDIYETPYEEIAEVTKAVKKVSESLKKIGADGVNVAMNNGQAAGQVVPHMHIHVIPRYVNDGFEMWHGKRGYAPGEMQEIAEKIAKAL
jgi:histidine triad (HIT) family protein